MTGRVRLCVVAACIVVLSPACWSPASKPPEPESSTPSVAPVSPPVIRRETARTIDFSERSQSAEFQDAVGALSNELSLRFLPMAELPGAYRAAASCRSVEQNLLKWHQAGLRYGVFLFRIDCHFDIDGRPDDLALLPTTDKYEVIQAVGTDGINYNIDNAAVIAWLREMEAQHPFTLTGAGMDFLEGYFVTPPRNAQPLAQRMYDFCPDIVEQGTGSVEALARELAKGRLYFWWD